ncbi:branched-chain amino acid aminotransferase [Halalkalicoccus paucihalophilus]|uniref:Branched-chain amino acid aminotransferase n=1 Tax=Halalkalicoccus paucihalophilus TaxID=1008153 RepID=A0A151A8U6_9EURY|nr:aminotransferase class IV [Halalkalicoccus paucihalophilus]KYH24116.1 branched-chain amino acid aminotransferase [Halalkalicoccus paucihalophilus]
MYYHVNGELVDSSNASVSVRDRGFMYGDAAFETLRAYGGSIFEWEAHLARLKRTCETLAMPDAVPGDLANRVEETLAANDLEDAYVRVSVTRGEQPGKLTPHPTVEPTIVVIVASLPRGGLDGRSIWDEPAVLRTVKTRRIPDEALPADIKTHNYLNGILARLELRRTQRGDTIADEALIRDLNGYITEGTTSNVFFITDGTLCTPSLDASILPGITRSVVLSLAQKVNIPVETDHYRIEDIHAANEVFLTNTTWELRPVTTLDGIEIETGAMTDRLIRLFNQRIEQFY